MNREEERRDGMPKLGTPPTANLGPDIIVLDVTASTNTPARRVIVTLLLFAGSL